MLVIEQIIQDGNCCLMSTYCMLSRLVWSFIYPKYNLVQLYQHYYFSVFIYFALIFNYIICLACLNFHLKRTNKQWNMALLSLLNKCCSVYETWRRDFWISYYDPKVTRIALLWGTYSSQNMSQTHTERAFSLKQFRGSKYLNLQWREHCKVLHTTLKQRSKWRPVPGKHIMSCNCVLARDTEKPYSILVTAFSLKFVTSLIFSYTNANKSCQANASIIIIKRFLDHIPIL